MAGVPALRFAPKFSRAFLTRCFITLFACLLVAGFEFGRPAPGQRLDESMRDLALQAFARGEPETAWR